MMEAAARQDLEGRSSYLRRHVPADSTAGVSLSGLTEASVAAMVTKASIGPQCKVAADQNIVMAPDIAMDPGITNLESSTQPDTSNSSLIAMPIEQRLGTSDETSVSAIVFYLMRANDAS